MAIGAMCASKRRWPTHRSLSNRKLPGAGHKFWWC